MEAFLAKWITPYLFWIKFGICALGAAAIFGAGMWLEGTIKDKVTADAKADRMAKIADDAIKILGQYQADASNIHAAATRFGSIQINNDEQFARLEGDLRNAFRNHPLPADCRPDDGRMRSLSAAIAATNSTAGFGPSPAVPKAP